MLKRKHMVLGFLAFCLAATLLVGVTSSAEYDPWCDINDDGLIDIVDIVNLAIRFGEEGSPINKTALLLELHARIAVAEANITDLNACMHGIEDNQYVPFKAVLSTNQTLAEQGIDDEDTIVIDSSATTGNFIVNGIIVKILGVDELVDYVRVHVITINGDACSWLSDDLTGDYVTRSGHELMGQPLHYRPGTLPHQIVVDCDTIYDLMITLKGGGGLAGSEDLTIPAGGIIVSGWKQAGDTITVTYWE